MMSMPRDRRPGWHLLGEDQQVLRAVGFRTDLQQKLRTRRRDTLARTSHTQLAIVFVQDGRLWRDDGSPRRDFDGQAEHPHYEGDDELHHVELHVRMQISEARP